MRRAATPLAASHPFVYSTGSIEREAPRGGARDCPRHAELPSKEPRATLKKVAIRSMERILATAATRPGKSDRS